MEARGPQSAALRVAFACLVVSIVAIHAGASASPSWYQGPPDRIDEPNEARDYSSASAGSSSTGDENLESHGEFWHKPLFPLDASDYAGILCAIFGLILASGGGIGGGGMLVPLYVLVMGFSPKHAIPLSNVTVFGGSIANHWVNRTKRHPSADRPLVDYDLILVMQPMTIAGALLGSFVNKLLPELVLTVCLVLLLALTTKEMLEKGFEAWAAESKAAEAAKESELTKLARDDNDDDGCSEEQGLLAEDDYTNGNGAAEGNDDDDAEMQWSSSTTGSSSDLRTSAATSSSSSSSELDTTTAGFLPKDDHLSTTEKELAAVYEEEKSVPGWKFGLLWSVFALVIVVSLLKGGGGYPSPVGITCGSSGFWVLTAAMFVFIVGVSAYVGQHLSANTQQKKRLGYKYSNGDIAWDERATVVYPLLCISAGLCAGMFGIGGGIVQVPLMLHLGVHPKVAAATSATMIMYTSFTALTSFYVFGLLLEDYAVALLVLGFVVTFVGQIGITQVIKKLGRDSLIILSVAAVVGFSCLLMGTHSILTIASHEIDLAAGKICETGEKGDS